MNTRPLPQLKLTPKSFRETETADSWIGEKKIQVEENRWTDVKGNFLAWHSPKMRGMTDHVDIHGTEGFYTGETKYEAVNKLAVANGIVIPDWVKAELLN